MLPKALIAQGVPIRRGIQVKRYTLFTTIEGRVGNGHAVGQLWRPMADVGTGTGPFDLNHLGAEVGQNLRAEEAQRHLGSG